MPTKYTTTFRKILLTPGEYPHPSGDRLDFSPERLRSLGDSGNKCLASGVNIPVPFAHYDDRANLVSPVNIAEHGKALLDAFTGKPIGWRADLNSGFVKQFGYGTVTDPETGKSQTGLYADLAIDGTPDQPESPAAKFGKTIKEVSLGIHTGDIEVGGEKYSELPIHVAACTNPVIPDQTNFVPVESLEPSSLLSSVLLFNTTTPKKPMAYDDKNKPEDKSTEGSDDMAPDAQEKPVNPAIPHDPQASEGPDAQCGFAVEGLRQHGIDLPEDTNMENFFDRIIIALRQKAADKASTEADSQDPSSLTQEPKGKTPTGAPIAMSQTANTPGTSPNQNSENNSENDSKAVVLFGQKLETESSALNKRVDALVKSGKVTAKFADEQLRPKIKETYTLSTLTLDQLDADGNLPAQPVEAVIEGLESAESEDLTQQGAATSTEAPNGSPVDPPVDAERGYWGFSEDGAHNEETVKDALSLSQSIPVA